jgi:hypothetical protein
MEKVVVGESAPNNEIWREGFLGSGSPQWSHLVKGEAKIIRWTLTVEIFCKDVS